MNIVYSPLHTVLAAGVLLIIPVVFHLIAFRKSIRFIHVLTSILVGNFILAFVSEIAGLTHFFDAKIILVFSLLIAGVSGYWINKKGIFSNEDIIGNNLSKSSILLVIGFAIFIFLYQKNTFPPFTQDSFAAYLSWARIIVNEHLIPAFYLETNTYYTIYLPPLLYTNIAFLFSLFGEYIDSIPAAIPLIYSCFFVFLITNWGEEYEGRGVPLFILLSLSFIPTYFLGLGSRVLQEAPLLFFTTASFYLLFKYLRTKETIFLVLLFISSALMSLTKYSGLLISALLFCILIIGTREKKEIIPKILLIFSLIHIPSILWAIRNLYLYNNPVYPSFRSIFKSISLGPSSIISSCGCQFSFPEMFTIFFNVFPAFIFTIFYIFRNWRNVEVQYVITCFVVFLVILYLSGWRLLVRYLFPFLGIFALYAGVEMSRLYDKIPVAVIKKKKKAVISIVIIIYCMMCIMIPGPGIHLSDIKSGNYKSVMSDLNLSDFDLREPQISSETVNRLRVLEYLEAKKEKNPMILGCGNSVLTWYGNYTALNPWDSLFILLNNKVNKEPFDFTKNSTYIHINLKKMGVNYIYALDSPSRLDEILFDKINQDPEHFELVYDKKGYRLWKIK